MAYLVQSFITFLAVFVFANYVPYKFLEAPAPGVRRIIAIAIAIGITYFIYRQFQSNYGRTKFIFRTAMLSGTAGFVIGYLGPILTEVTSSQGAMLAVLYTGPAGFMAGLAIGPIIWLVRQR